MIFTGIFTSLHITLAIFGLVIIGLLFYVISLERRLHRVFRGRKAHSLEDTIAEIQNRLNAHHSLAIKNSGDIKELDDKMKHCVRNVSTLRFKPFEDAGSTQSFATALIDDHKNGVVISSLYTRDRMSIFAKPIVGGKSEYELTNEEKSVLADSSTSNK